MADRRHAAGEVLAITVVLAACSLMYELLVAQTLSLLAGNTVVWYSLTVGSYLGAMGLGAAFFGARGRHSGWHTLFRVELLLCVVGSGAVLAIHLTHGLYLYGMAATGDSTVLAFFGVSLGIIVLVGALSGIELPLLIKLGNEASADGTLTNRVLGWDYLGALVAGLLFPLVLVPRFELAVIGLGTGLVNLLVAAWVLLRFAGAGRALRPWAVLTATLGGLLVFGISRGDGIQQYFLQRYYYTSDAAAAGAMFTPLDHVPDVFRAYSPYQKIDLVTDSSEYFGDHLIDAYSTKYVEDPDFPRNRYLFLNGDFQLNSDYEELYHEWFAHVPILLHGRVPQRVLVLGAGDGLLIRELVKHPGIRSITHVDLDSRLVELANTHPTLTTMNRHALGDPRVQTRFGDAFQYVRRSRDTYDAIYLDFPYVMDYNLSKLYSREFFHFVRARLADGGYAVLDAPGGNYAPVPDGEGYLRLSRGDEAYVYFNTIRSAGFEDVVAFASRLELDNPAAIAALEALWEEQGRPLPPVPAEELAAALRREQTLQYLEAHADNVEQGFMAMWKGGREVRTPAWRDLGVPLSALSEKRFALTLPPPLPAEDPIDWFLVNSILRPTLPNRPLLSVRYPW